MKYNLSCLAVYVALFRGSPRTGILGKANNFMHSFSHKLIPLSLLQDCTRTYWFASLSTGFCVLLALPIVIQS